MLCPVYELKVAVEDMMYVPSAVFGVINEVSDTGTASFDKRRNTSTSPLTLGCMAGDVDHDEWHDW